MTKQLENALPRLEDLDSLKLEDVVIHARFFALGSAATWLIAAYEPETGILFGYADLFGVGSPYAEWGYISLRELETLRYLGIARIERDIWFKAKPFPDCIRGDGTIK